MVIEGKWEKMYNCKYKENARRTTSMKPRIFISSTFYDLKYIREDISNFIKAYDYEPVLFENGDIGYTPGKKLDASCYDSMKNADMVILIIGGEYGSAATGEKEDAFTEYLSITRNEFRTAIDAGIPVFVMIDKKVMVEYGVYEANYNLIEKEKKEIKFALTKNVNIFRFIKEVKGMVAIPIQEFEKSAEIKEFISKQWADMFKNYLVSLKDAKEDKKIEISVNEMKALIQKMDIMIDSVGKNLLSKGSTEEYDSVVKQQECILFCNSLLDAFRVNHRLNKEATNINRKEIIRNFLKVLQELKDNKMTKATVDNLSSILSLFEKYGFTMSKIANDFEKIFKDMDLLTDDKNMEVIVEILSKDEYFNKLVVLHR